MHSFLLTPLTQNLHAFQMVCHFIPRHSKFRFLLPDLISTCIILLEPSANGGSTGHAWLAVESFCQKTDVVLDNARIVEEHFDLSFEIGDVQVQFVMLVQKVIETLSDFEETSQGTVIEG